MSVGIHINKASHLYDITYKTMLEAIEFETEELNLSAISLFVIGPRSRHPMKIDHSSIKKYCQTHNISIYPHGAYTSVSIWHINKNNILEDNSIKYIEDIKNHLEVSGKIGAKGVVIHLSRHNIKTIVEVMHLLSVHAGIKELADPPMLILESPASKAHPDLTYETPDKLNKLVYGINNAHKNIIKWGICLDTCHLYAGGVSMEDPNSWNEYIGALTKHTYDKIKLIHLNGALLQNYNTGKDLHIIPMSEEDAIWGSLIPNKLRKYLDAAEPEDVANVNVYKKLTKSDIKKIKDSSLYDIIKFAKANSISMIMEINRGSYNDAKAALDIVNGLL